ncbi:MAG: class I SAM-dependent methyltransferase [Pseudomonadota bacterium]
MLDFIKKKMLWDAWENNLEKEIGARGTFHLKSIQDLTLFAHLKDYSNKSIAEIGGGNSKILSALAARNHCFNIEKFEGQGNGPTQEIEIEGVENIIAFLGEKSGKIPSTAFDVVFSISVVEHVPTEMLDAFLEEGLECLKPGGLWIHAIDLYIEEDPSDWIKERFAAYQKWFSHPDLIPIGDVHPGPIRFTTDMATNPDDEMFRWGQYAPSLIELRKIAQSVSIILAGTKRN